MSVDFGDILHVLAHELRTPIGIAHGYVRLLLEDRLAHDKDKRRALEQMQKALGRLSELSQESSALASWLEANEEYSASVAANVLLSRIMTAEFEGPVTIEPIDMDGNAVLRTRDVESLAGALITLVGATARELRGTECAIAGRIDGKRLEILVGPREQHEALRAGPGAPDASPLVIERGGLGLAFVHAMVVLDAHGAERWTIKSSKQAAGLRLPIEERPRQ